MFKQKTTRDTEARNEPSLTIREAAEGDADAVRRLAERDSAPVPRGGLLLAEQDGVAVAAVASDGTVIADPFRPTAEIVAVLELRARQRERPPAPARRRRLVARSRRAASRRLRTA